LRAWDLRSRPALAIGAAAAIAAASLLPAAMDEFSSPRAWATRIARFASPA
jgi:hypothetical protein